jgi:hypothetical protein
MKKFFLKPGFEFIFALSLIAILGLPPMLMAQSQKDIDIQIVNGDTTVNGKNIKQLSADERREALKDINRMNISGMNDKGTTLFSLKKKDSLDGKVRRFEMRKERIARDSTGDMVNGHPGAAKRMEYNFAFKNPGSGDDNKGFRGRGFNPPLMRSERRNSQNFDYVSTDKDGISTHVRFHVSEVSNDDLKRMPHVEGAKFEIADLNLVPEFSTGKTLLMFSLPDKKAAEVKLTDDEGKILWTEKAIGGNFSKSFVLGLNGVYYLQVKQGYNVSVRKIMKDE